MFISISKNFEFLNVYHHGKSYANRYLVMYILKMAAVITDMGLQSVKKLETVLSGIGLPD